MVISQAVMLYTNELMMFASLAFFLAAMLIRAAPKPTRAIALGATHSLRGGAIG